MTEQTPGKRIEQLLVSPYEWKGEAFDHVMTYVREHPEVAKDEKIHQAAIRFLRENINASGSSLEAIKTLMEVFALDPAKEMTEMVIQTFNTRIQKGVGSIPFGIMQAFHIEIPPEVIATIKTTHPDAPQKLVHDHISTGRISPRFQEYFSQAHILAEIFQLSPQEIRAIAIRVCASVVDAQNIQDESILRRTCEVVMTAFQLEASEIFNQALLKEIRAEHETDPLPVRNQPSKEEREKALEARVEAEVASIMLLPEESRLVIIRNYMATSQAALEQFGELLDAYIKTESTDIPDESLPSLSLEETDFRRRVALRVAERMALEKLFPRQTKKN